MSSNDNGGYVYPGIHRGDTLRDMPGLTLRDYFAAKAMQGFLANAWQAQQLDETGDSSREQMAIVAEISYVMADSMIEERGGGTDEQLDKMQRADKFLLTIKDIYFL